MTKIGLAVSKFHLLAIKLHQRFGNTGEMCVFVCVCVLAERGNLFMVPSSSTE